MEYVNAKRVFPKALLREVQKYRTGYVYIPERRDRYLARNRWIFQHSRRGVNVETIAKWYGLSARRVRQILQEEREELVPDGTPPDAFEGMDARWWLPVAVPLAAFGDGGQQSDAPVLLN